ncbi:MAG: DUF3598 domain-containing protein [Pseudomonadota bacterium]
MSNIKTDMPILSSNEGVWTGWYRHYDPDGKLFDEHRSKLICRFPDDGPVPYHQTNVYQWDDGKIEVRDFPATYKDKRVWFDNDLIYGWAAEVPLDEYNRTTMLNWVRKGEDDLYLYEMIHNSDCGKFRSRVWQWLKGGKIHMRTLIDETKKTDDWASETADRY